VRGRLHERVFVDVETAPPPVKDGERERSARFRVGSIQSLGIQAR